MLHVQTFGFHFSIILLKFDSEPASLYEFGKRFHNKLSLKIRELTLNLFALHYQDIGELFWIYRLFHIQFVNQWFCVSTCEIFFLVVFKIFSLKHVFRSFNISNFVYVYLCICMVSQKWEVSKIFLYFLLIINCKSSVIRFIIKKKL